MQEIINLKHQKHFRYTIWSLQVLIKQGKDVILMLLHELLYLYFAIALPRTEVNKGDSVLLFLLTR